jgi:Uma2 family endonuclease
MSESLLLADPPVSIAAFDVFLTGQVEDRSWELVEGRIVGMTNPSERHEQIVANVGVPLRQAVGPKGCRVYFGGMRIQISDDARGLNKARPDLLVRCGAVTGKNYVTDPLVVVEVLSPSTIDTDRGDKLRFYKRLPTLTHIVLIYQDQQRAEHYRRGNSGWDLEVLIHPDDLLRFEALGCTVSLSDAYEGVHPGV